MTIIIVRNGQKPEKIEESGFAKESELQEYLINNPEIVPLDKIEEHKKLLTLAREFQTDSGYIDAIATDNDGEIYIIESKLYKNPDKRKVLAQALEYGSALWAQDGAEDFLLSLSEACHAQFGVSLQEKVKDFFKFDDDDLGEFTENIKRNFERGAFKFLILMDSLSEPLKRLILYINQNSAFDIYAVEIKQYKTKGLSISIPDLFGAETSKKKNKEKARAWDFESFASERLRDCGDEEIVSVVKKIIDFSEENSIKVDWKKSKRGSFVLVFESAGKPVYLLSVHGNCAIEWNLPHQGASAPEPFNGKATQEKILQKLSQNFNAFVNTDTPSGYSAVNIPLSELKDESKLNAFFEFLLFVKSLCK